MKQFKRDENQNSNKLHLDKYYTDEKIAKYCMDKTFEILKNENITEIIEPSAGNGSFSKQIKNCIAYDIEPEDESIIKQDFLKLELEYKKGRLFIGNPPFGARNSLSIRFIRHSFEFGDFVAFIQPISQYDNKNNNQLNCCELIYSEKLLSLVFSDKIKLNCCFNIYKKSIQKNKDNINNVFIIKESRQSRNQHIKDLNYDVRICAWGSIGKIVEYPEQYAKEFAIYILDENKKEEILKLLENVNWAKEYDMMTTPNLLQWHVKDYLNKKLNKN